MFLRLNLFSYVFQAFTARYVCKVFPPLCSPYPVHLYLYAKFLFPGRSGQLCLLLCACACEFGFCVRVSEIKRSKSNYLVNIFVSHRVVPYDDKNSRRFISDSIDHLILSYSTWRSFARNASARTTIRLSCHKVKLRSSRDIQPCFTMSSQVMLISNLNLSN